MQSNNSNMMDLLHRDSCVVDFTGKIELVKSVEAQHICGIDNDLDSIANLISVGGLKAVYLVGAPEGALDDLKEDTGLVHIYSLAG